MVDNAARDGTTRILKSRYRELLAHERERPHHLDLESTVYETQGIIEATFVAMVGDDVPLMEARRRLERLSTRLNEITDGLAAAREIA